MIFAFDEAAGEDEFELKGERYKHLIKVRRHQAGDVLALRHPDRSATLYRYEILGVDGRRARLRLIDAAESHVGAKRNLRIGWCMIDPKSVEKVLPQLCEMGVAEITFIACGRSQKQFRPDLPRLERIVLSSMQQCGRSEPMALGICESLDRFAAEHPEAVVLDFAPEPFSAEEVAATLLIGCEGGFTSEERERLSGMKIRRFDSPLVLRSETAAVAAAAKVLL